MYDPAITVNITGWSKPYELGLAQRFLTKLARFNTAMPIKYTSESLPLLELNSYPLDNDNPALYVDICSLDLSDPSCLNDLRSKIDIVRQGGYYLCSGIFYGASENVNNETHIETLAKLEQLLGQPIDGRNSIIRMNGSNSTNPDTDHMRDSTLFLIIKKI